ncbi:MAG: PilZ domain-containing protein [Magnetococcales bacterium]|nr:PilZ domain-containing protein [Magnetococcales bacterium]
MPTGVPLAKIMGQIRRELEETRSVLLAINQLEWKALECPIPPQELMKTFKTHQPFLKHLTLSIEDSQATLGAIQSSIDQGDPEERIQSALLPLYQQTRVYLQRVKHIHTQVSISPVIDRRLQAENNAAGDPPKVDHKRSKDSLLYEFCGTSYHGSRRRAERTQVNSSFELTLASGGTITGQTVDISKSGLAVESDTPDPSWAKEMQGTVTLGIDPDKSEFSCYLVRVAGKRAAMTIANKDEDRFVKLVRDRVLGGAVGGLVTLDSEFTISL